MLQGFLLELARSIRACTYVLRMMTQQIANFTFSSTSPIRHVVRIALGALAGVAIGLGGIATNSGLSAAALAFVAGYAVEPVFQLSTALRKSFGAPRSGKMHFAHYDAEYGEKSTTLEPFVVH
jgi:uncharacterized membrane protein